MQWVVVSNGRTLRVIRGLDNVRGLDIQQVRSVADAHVRLRRYAGDPLAMATLRRVLAQDGGAVDATRVSDRQVLHEISARIAAGRFGLASEPDVLARLKPVDPEAPHRAPEPRTKPTWVEFKVVWDANGMPVPHVRLWVRTPDGKESSFTTTSAGTIRIDGIPRGDCDVRSELTSPTRSNTVGFEGFDEPLAPVDTGKQEIPSSAASYQIARIDRHRVTKRDSIRSLATAAGLSWQDLAKFNWGTSVPKELNRHLRDEVGCTKKTKDKRNYVFDDSDEPGIVLIPRPWRQGGLATDMTHVIRVRPRQSLVLRLEDEKSNPIPAARYEVTFFDGSKRSGALGENGSAVLLDTPHGPFAVSYPDQEDVLAKSLAARARKAFEKHDCEDIFYLLNQPPAIIRRAIDSYEAHFDDHGRGGLIEDIYQEVTDEDALNAVEALMAYAGLRTRSDVQFLQRLEDERYRGGEGG